MDNFTTSDYIDKKTTSVKFILLKKLVTCYIGSDLILQASSCDYGDEIKTIQCK